MLLLNCSHAQTCGGELVKFRETFGSGATKSALATGRTNYNYNGTGSLTDGDYVLSTSTQAKPEWHIASDHTGGLNGRMMVTNASYAPGEFYRDTVYDVSSVSTYNIYFYAMNVNTVGTCAPNPILPRLQVVVESYNFDGTFTEIYTLTSDLLTQASTPTWVRISGQFYLPTACTAVRYRIINNSTGGCGNDLAIDDITFAQCNPTLLPVNGLTLKAAKENNANKLSWSTLTEINTDRFLIEKSTDNKTWKGIGMVKASGESHTRKEYSFTDRAPDLNCTYRIVSVDNDGSAFYSNVINIKVSAGANSHLSAYPNPFVDRLNLDMNVKQPQMASIRIFDCSGKMLKVIPWLLKAGENMHTISGLSAIGGAGMYLITVTDTNGVVLGRIKSIKN